MACVSGQEHTITLSDDGILHAFGRNSEGQLGLGNNNSVSLPTPIPNLPKIKLISCGYHSTVCVDCEGFMWSIGQNNYGQLGTGNKTNFNVPQKIQGIPPVRSVSCGEYHTLIITTDSNLWSCGYNNYGQLCNGNQVDQLKPQKTSFLNISKISAGCYHSLFQNNKGEIFACGINSKGQCGLGHFNHPQITPSLIVHAHSNIVQFFSGYQFCLFLGSEGNVYSVGYGGYGSLGLGNNTNQNVLNKIPNIPPIKTISCVNPSCYLIDFEGNLWSFGYNVNGQLGHGDKTNINIPKIISSLKDIQQISHGSRGHHFFAKNSQNEIFGTGYNNCGQLGTGDTQSVSIPKKINSQYFTIWGSNQDISPRWNGMASETTMNCNKEEIPKLEMIQSKIQTVKVNLQSNNNNKIKQEFPQNSFESWNEVHEFLNEKSKQINSKLNKKQDIELQNQKDIQTYEIELKEINNQIQQLQLRKKEIEENLLPKAKQSQCSLEENFKKMENKHKVLKEMCSDVSTFCKNENEMNQELGKLFNEKKLEEFDCSEISKVLWKMDLTKYQPLFEQNQINGQYATMLVDDWAMWKKIGVQKRDYCFFKFYLKMMKCAGYSKTFSPDYEHDCCVCSHASIEKTIHLLAEYDIPFDRDIILKNNYCIPILIDPSFRDILVPDVLSPEGRKILLDITKWKKLHKKHLKDLCNKN